MARYICRFLVHDSPTNLKEPLRELIQSCNFELIYEIEDYLMGREIPGNVAFSKLATVEVLLDTTTATDNQVQLSFVVKNEELPLQLNNHCKQLFDLLCRSIDEKYDWRVLGICS
jgi:hypothetical protein